MSVAAPLEAGRRVAGLFARSARELFSQLCEAGAVPAGEAERAQSAAEWECFALFGCVRGIVAASGFAPRTAETIDAMHASVFADWDASARHGETADARRALLSRRYEEYETIAQTGGASGAHDAATRLGAAAAKHMFGGADSPADLAELLGSMHEILAEAVVAMLSGEADLPAGDASPRGIETRAGHEHPRGAEPRSTDALAPGIETPPLEGARQITGRLERLGLTCAIGGSGLLASLGLATHVRDWDLTTDAPRAAVEAALAGLDWEYKGSDELHADEKFMFPERALEVIRGFAFFSPGGIVRVPTIVTRRWAGLPVGSPECWAVAYHLLDRTEKRDALLQWLRSHGANRHTLEALLAQPLSRELAVTLTALPLAPSTR
jgi:hypothetical protein